MLSALSTARLPWSVIGRVLPSPSRQVSVSVWGQLAVQSDVAVLRDTWEENSFALEYLQRARECVSREKSGLSLREGPKWTLPFTPQRTPPELVARAQGKPRVAILREEGSNGDREMAAMVFSSGMEPWDICMEDLISGQLSLDDFRGIVFVGGFRCPALPLPPPLYTPLLVAFLPSYFPSICPCFALSLPYFCPHYSPLFPLFVPFNSPLLAPLLHLHT